MRLLPNADAFIACYPDWHRDVAQLIADDQTQATFGVFGRWGSGKSSACIAIRQALIELSTQRERYIGIIEINLIDVQHNRISDKIAATITELVGRQPGPKLDTQTRKTLSSIIASFCSFGSALALASTGQAPMGAEVAVAGGAALGGVAAEGISKLLDLYSAGKDEKERAAAEQIVENDQLVIVFDDLDRCYPDRAIHFLATVGEFFHSIHPKLRCNLVIACDPEVLARHAAHVFGISLTEGLEAITKYIHAPINIPVGFVGSHRETINKSIPINLRQRELVLNTVCSVIGAVPIREILVSIPQFLLWAKRYHNGNQSDEQRVLQKILSMLLLFSLISTSIPSVLRYIIKEDAYPIVLRHLFSGKELHDDGANVVMQQFGQSVVDALTLRPDIIRASKLLGLPEMEFHSTELTKILRVIGVYAR